MQRETSFMDMMEELQIAIFLMLDVKSVLCCKCVCKRFLYLLENHSFVINHLKNQIHSQSQTLIHYGLANSPDPFYEFDHLLLSIDDETKEVDSCLALTPPIPIIEGFFRSYVIGSCNGLICLAVWFGDHSGAWELMINPEADIVDNDGFSVLLWNPVIKQCRYLPRHHLSCQPAVFEFGYIPETDDYLVVKVGSPGFQLEVYKMSTDSWRSIEFNWLDTADFVPNVYRDRTPVFVDGSFHWAIKDVNFNYIAYFNLKGENLGLMKVKENDGGVFDVLISDGRRWELSAVEDKLAVIYCSFERHNLFDIWVMDEYGVAKSWTCRYKIVEASNMFMRPLAYWTNGLVLLLWLTNAAGNLEKSGNYFYDIESRSLKSIPSESMRWGIKGLTNFVETLVPVRKVEL